MSLQQLKQHPTSHQIQASPQQIYPNYQDLLAIYNYNPPALPAAHHQEQNWKATFLQVYRTSRGTILRQIRNINFDFLQTLNFIQARIESIQALCYFRAPNLQKICLEGNVIVNTRSLRKIESSKIKSLNFTNNKIQELQGLQMGNWKNLEKLSVQNMSFDHIQNQGLQFMMKLSTRSKKVLASMQAQHRIINKLIFDKFSEKFEQRSCLLLSTGSFK